MPLEKINTTFIRQLLAISILTNLTIHLSIDKSYCDALNHTRPTVIAIPIDKKGKGLILICAFIIQYDGSNLYTFNVKI